MTSDQQPHYLKPNVAIEPLIDSWYAWPQLVFPPARALNLAHRQLRLLESYLVAPEVHRDAAGDPSLLGGPFLDFGSESRVADVRALLVETKERRHSLLELAEAVTQLTQLLAANANGGPLEALYARVPNALKGYVELHYDLSDRPGFRFYERLLYESRFNADLGQSVALQPLSSDHRPFVLSTPRLASEDSLQRPFSFKSEELDRLLRARDQPIALGAVRELFGLSHANEGTLRPYLTTEKRRGPAPPEQAIRTRYFGHGTVLIETAGIAILTDPLLAYDCGEKGARFVFSDLPETIDYLLITHAHPDHAIPEFLLQLRHRVKNVVVPRTIGGTLLDFSLKRVLHELGFESVIELDELDSIVTPAGQITSIPFLGEHGDLDVRGKAGYLVSLSGKKFLFLADSSNLEPELYRHVQRQVGNVDVLFVGMECDGAPLTFFYGPLRAEAPDHRQNYARKLIGSDYAKVMDLIDCFRVGEVYIYAMGYEPWATYILALRYDEHCRAVTESNRVVEACRARGIPAERLFGKKEICH